MFHKLNLLKFGYGTMNFDYGALQRLLHNLPHLDCLDFGTVPFSNHLLCFLIAERYFLWLLMLKYILICRILPCLKNMKKKKLRIGSSTSLFIDTAKTIKIWRFAATEKELYLIKVLLDVSSVLEKMYIWGGLSKQQEILMLPRLNKQ